MRCLSIRSIPSCRWPNRRSGSTNTDRLNIRSLHKFHGPRREIPPRVSVVVPVLNGEASIEDCLRSLLATEYELDRREIIVVDNGSTDRTAEIIRRYPVRYVFEPRRGPSRARNAGIEAAEGDVIAFTDADCLATTGWLRELVGGFNGADVGGVAGEILPYLPSTAAERYAARIRHLSPDRYLRREVFPFAVTANLAFRREVFERVGLLDTDSPRGGESTDFCTRFFRVTGQRLELARRAVVLHRHRSTAWGLFRQQYGYGKGHAYLYIKYRDDIRWDWSKTARVYRDLGQSALALIGSAGAWGLRRTSREDLSFHYFEFLRKLALRMGFAREAWSRGYPYL